MNFEPQKFFIGLMDFFYILLPGALLTYLAMDEMGPVVLGCDKYQDLTDAKGVVAFLVVSYLVGHLVFLLGSWLDIPYDWLRRRSLNKQIIRLAHRGTLSPWFVRALCWIVFKQEQDLAVNCAGKIKEQALKPLQAKEAVNTFQWSKALLAQEHPESLATVQRFEADSKFFRCFSVVLTVLAITWPFGKERLLGTGILGILFLFALLRYMEQRYKATNQAYWSVITLTAKDGKMNPDQFAGPLPNPPHAGGVLFKKNLWGKAKFLLVEAKDNPAQWVLPKGHVEEGEEHREAAVREVHEETGVWARIVRDMGDVSYMANGTRVTVRCFLMCAIGKGLRKDKDRQDVWLTLSEAVARASHVETRELLQASDAQRPRG